MPNTMDMLVDYVVMAHSRRRTPELSLPVETPFATSHCPYEQPPDDDCLLVETEAQARLSPLIAEALEILSRDVHAEDDRARLPKLAPSDAVVLVKQYGSLRRAASASGYTRATLHRALQGVTTL